MLAPMALLTACHAWFGSSGGGAARITRVNTLTSPPWEGVSVTDLTSVLGNVKYAGSTPAVGARQIGLDQLDGQVGGQCQLAARSAGSGCRGRRHGRGRASPGRCRGGWCRCRRRCRRACCSGRRTRCRGRRPVAGTLVAGPHAASSGTTLTIAIAPTVWRRNVRLGTARRRADHLHRPSERHLPLPQLVDCLSAGDRRHRDAVERHLSQVWCDHQLRLGALLDVLDTHAGRQLAQDQLARPPTSM